MLYRHGETLLEHIESYLKDCLAREQSPRTLEGKKTNLYKFAHWCLGLERPVLYAKDISLDVLEDYRQYIFLYRFSKLDKEYEPSTRRCKLTSVKVFLKRLYFLDVLNSNPGERFELPTIPRHLPMDYLLPEELDVIFRYVLSRGGLKAIRNRVILELLFASGIRREELVNLMLSDINIEHRVLKVRQGKGQKDRIVVVSERACEWVQYYAKQIRPKHARLDSGDALFLDNKGSQFRNSQLTRIAGESVRRAGIDKPGACNIFRHTAATTMLENGADIRMIQEQLGHADISTTEIYAHVSLKRLKKVYMDSHPSAFMPYTPVDQEINELNIG